MLYVAWVVLHRNRHIGASERRQLIPHVRFQVPFLGPESQLKSGFAWAGLLCVDERRSCSWGNPLRRSLSEKMMTIRISFPKLRKQSRSSVSFDIMPKTATYNQCYLVQAAKRYILRTSMERIKYGPSWSQALVQTDLHVEEVVACW